MSGLRRQANRASDWLVRAVLLGRQFHGRWKLVREQRAPFQGQRRNCNHIGDRLPARVTGVMGGMAPTADSRVTSDMERALPEDAVVGVQGTPRLAGSAAP